MYHKSKDKYYSIYLVKYYNPTTGYWCWTDGTDHYLSAIIGKPIKSKYDTGGTLTSSDIAAYSYNGYAYYLVTINSIQCYLWWSPTLGYVISAYLGYGTDEYQDALDDDKWKGDLWWNCATLIGTYAKRGVGKEPSNGYKDAYVEAGIVEGWKLSGTSVAGVYEEVVGSAVSGHKWIGWKILQDGGSNEFIQNSALYGTLETYTGARSIWYDAIGGTYIISAVIGTKDAAIGYWSCATLLGTYTRTYTGGGTAPTPETYVISHKEYREMSNGTVNDGVATYMGQVAIWL